MAEPTDERDVARTSRRRRSHVDAAPSRSARSRSGDNKTRRRVAQRAKASSPSSKSGQREASSPVISHSAHPTSAAAAQVSEMAKSASAADAITSRLRFGRLRRKAAFTGKPVAAESP